MPTDFADLVGPELASALEEKGFTDLTQVQKAVLDPALAGRDLRVTSQTGSGKTVAIGFILRALAAEPSSAKDRLAHPRALVIVPTRELAKQFVEELRWLYAPIAAKVAGVTGGAVYRDEMRALAQNPVVVVGTPGRMLDHLNRGSIMPSEVGAVVLDEADRMLDLGFREELESILALTPKERATHLVSATFPRDVEALANSVQKQPAHVQGTRLGVANVDIDHVLHVVEPRQRLDAVVNLLLASPEAQTLLFVRTRADVSEVADKLGEAGFAVTALSGEMEQRERDRALNAFRRGDQRVLVATDVAARGIDVQDVTLVIHLEPPTDPDSYTHRSGRTGRAGRKGKSVLIVVPSAQNKTTMLLRRAKVTARVEPVPSAQMIREQTDQRFFDTLTSDEGEEPTEQQRALVARLIARDDHVRAISRLLALARAEGPTQPREVRHIDANSKGPARGKPAFGREREFNDRERSFPPRERAETRERGPARPARAADLTGDWVPFRVSWGGEHGADARKLLAMVCRWGEISGGDVGAIEVERNFSRLRVKASVAAGFADATSKPDKRNPRVTIQLDRAGHSEGPPGEGRAPRTLAPKAPEPRGDQPAHAKRAPRDAAPHAPREHASRPHAPRDAGPREHAPRPHTPRTEGPHASRPHAPRAEGPREHTPRAPGKAPSGGFPRDATRRRKPVAYGREASGPREGWRAHPTREAAPKAAPENKPAGTAPPKRRRVVTR